MKKRRWPWVLLGAAAAPVLLIVMGWAVLMLWLPTDREVMEGRLGVSIPRQLRTEVEDTHGGFHGDGVCKVVVTFPTQEAAESFAQELPDTWNPLPIEDEALWQAVQGVWPDLPQSDRGDWFYLDRYFAQYGRVCPFNSYLQNATFALLDLDENRLYVLEVDC